MAHENGNPEIQPASKPEINESEYASFNTSNELGHAIYQARTNGGVSISAELFEKLYLGPKTAVKGELRATFGNPTPMYVHSFMSLAGIL